MRIIILIFFVVSLTSCQELFINEQEPVQYIYTINPDGTGKEKIIQPDFPGWLKVSPYRQKILVSNDYQITLYNLNFETKKEFSCDFFKDHHFPMIRCNLYLLNKINL
jgi:hypothetical protein